MPVIKTVTIPVYDIRYGKLELWMEGTILHFRRHYQLLDEIGNELYSIGKRDYEGAVEFDSLSAPLKSAIVNMTTYTEVLIKTQEGIV